MSFFIIQFLKGFLNIFIIFLIILVFFILLNKKKSSLIVIIFFYLLGTEIIAQFYKPVVDNFYVKKDIEILEKADAVVIFGGSTGLKFDGNKYFMEWNDADRFMSTFEIYKKNKGSYIILPKSAPSIDNRLVYNKNLTHDFQLIYQFLKLLGIDDNKIIFTENEVQDTFSEVKEIYKTVQAKNFKSLIIVSSAYHLKRIDNLVQKIIPKINIQYYPTDFSNNVKYYSDYFSFDLSNIDKLNILLKEFIGQLYYVSKPH